MSKKLYALILALVGAVCTVVDAFVTYYEVKYCAQISTVCTAIPPFVAEMLLLFTVDEIVKLTKGKKE